MHNLFIITGVLAIILAGLNLRSLGNVLIFSVSVMGHHADMRKLLVNNIVFWISTSLIVAPVLYFGWELSSTLASLNGVQLRLASYLFSSLFLAWGLFNLYVYKVGARRDSEGRLRRKIVNLSRSAGNIQQDFVFGVFNGFSILLSELGLFLGGIWLIQKGGGFGYIELGLAILMATGAIWIVFLCLLYGLNLSNVERFRKAHGPQVSFFCGLIGIFGSWLILASSMGLL